MAISNVKLASFSACPTFEIGTKASAALADLISCPGQFSFIPARAVYRNFAKGWGGRIWDMTLVLCEAQGGCYTLHLLCWHASVKSFLA